MSVKKRKFLNFTEKLEVIDTAERFHLSIRKLSAKFGISKTQVAEILKKKEDIRKSSENVNLHRKRKFPNTENNLLDHTVFDWVCKARLSNIRITGPVLRGTALEVAKELEMKAFKASNGWLEKFCLRWNITLKPGSGETAGINAQPQDASEWKEKFHTLIQEYMSKDIFAVHETPLFFRALPEEFALINEQCVNDKSSKERLTVLFCTSMTGEKEKPLVIGASKSLNFLGESVEWYFNEKASITRNIMTEWLRKFDRKMQRKNRKVLLFLNNAMSHPKVTLSNVMLVFFPPSITSHCQPLSHVIHNFKLLYRKFVLRRLLASMDESGDTRQFKETITVLNAVVWITAAWKKVKPELINGCFTEAGFGKYIKVDAESADENDILLSTVMGSQGINLFDYANIDEKLLTENSVTEVSCVHKKYAGDNGDSDSHEESIGVTTGSVINIKEAYGKLKDLETFFLTYDATTAQKITEIVSYTESVILNNMASNV